MPPLDRVCSVDQCDVRVAARGWCNRHYLRWRNHGDPLGGSPGPSVLRAVDYADGTRLCSSCGARQELQAFDKDVNASGGRRTKCKACRSSQMKDWYAANQVRQRDRQRDRFARNVDSIRVQDSARYERNRQARLELAKAVTHKRRALLRSVEFDSSISVGGIRSRDGDDCCYCGLSMTFESVRHGEYLPGRATVEHVMPISRGGGHVWGNVKLACWQCNVRKNARTETEWAVVAGEALGARGATGVHAAVAEVGAEE